MNDSPKTFENSAIRTIWNDQEEEWYFSVVDVVGVLTEQASPRTASTYWAVLKKRLTEEGAEQLLTNCKQLKMKSTDGKMRLTDVANTEQLLRIIQSIPSKKAEPFKLWLAEVGKERIEETIDPEQTIDRALATYAKKGYSREWINQRLQAIQVRKELTDEWENRGVKKGIEYAILTDEITKAWSGMTTRDYKKHNECQAEIDYSGNILCQNKQVLRNIDLGKDVSIAHQRRHSAGSRFPVIGKNQVAAEEVDRIVFHVAPEKAGATTFKSQITVL